MTARGFGCGAHRALRALRSLASGAILSSCAVTGFAQTAATDAERPRLLAAAPKTPKVKVDIKGVDRASVILDTRCEVLVKPYAVTDNLMEVAGVIGKGALDQAGDALTSVFSGGKPSLKTATFLAAAKLTAKRSNWLPMQAEVLIGERGMPADDELVPRDSKKGIEVYGQANRLLKEILDRVKEPYDYDFKLYVVKTSATNAAAVAGGYLFVDNGLVADNKLLRKARFALAHEIAHVLRRHETQEIQSMIIDSVTSATELVSMFKGMKMSPQTILDHVGIEKHRFTQHHIAEELEADSCAVMLLSKVLHDDVELQATVSAFVDDMPNVAEVDAPLAPNASDIEKLAASVTTIVDSPIQRHPTNADRKKNLAEIQKTIATGLTDKR